MVSLLAALVLLVVIALLAGVIERVAGHSDHGVSGAGGRSAGGGGGACGCGIAIDLHTFTHPQPEILPKGPVFKRFTGYSYPQLFLSPAAAGLFLGSGFSVPATSACWRREYGLCKHVTYAYGHMKLHTT